MYKFHLSVEAQNELEELTQWYMEIDSNLADKFRDEYQLTMKKLLKSPTHFYFISKELRRCKFPKIKAFIVFKIENDFIEILSVKDSRSKPNKKYY